ncbi:MAG: (2Fe-2S) ferredoxin domain-containing protein [Chloroflexota bacterium]
MEKTLHHILVCASFRTSGEPKGICHKKGAADHLAYLENEIIDRGLDASVSSTGCLKQCANGPIVVVYPENHWYGNVDSEEAIDTILDAIESGHVASNYWLG